MSTKEKVLVPRRFRLADASGEAGGSPLGWPELADHPMVVVLGEPGAGKSTELAREAARTGGAFFSIREFLAGLVPPSGSGPLFLDGLDEVRASGSNRISILLQIAVKLRGLGQPQVRLSCRAADWFGELDQKDLARTYTTEQIQVVELQPLRAGDVEQIVLAADLADPAAFLETVRRQGMEDWLGNPQTLELMIAVARKGPLPATKAELFEKACLLMAGEQNLMHRRAQPIRVSSEKILEAAGFLCALFLIAGLEGFAGDRSEAGDGFPVLDEIPGPPTELRAAVESRLFRWEDGRAVPIHRTVAEFLAARFLSDRIAGGLPLERVLQLITGHDGGTLSDLRGLFAWLTSLLPGHAEALARRDPAAVIFYGDPAPLPPLVKRAVLAGLERLADRYPWFFYEGRSKSFGALADPALIPDFRAALADSAKPRYYRLAVLATLAYGRVLPELREDLRRLVYDKDTPQGLRELALKALIHGTSNKSDLLAVLEDVQEGVLFDDEDSMRAALLESLYPEVVNPGGLIRYLTVPKDPHHYGDYHRFVRKGLSSRTANYLVPDLLDALSDPRIWSGHRRRGGWLRAAWSGLAGGLLRRGLEIYGDSVPVARLWSWLKVSRDQGVFSILEKEDQAAVREWFNARPQRILELYRWWVLEGSVAEGVSLDFGFWSALYHPTEPPDLWQWELSTAASWGRGERAESLLRSVVNRLYSGATRPTLDELFEWAEQHPTFRDPLDSLLYENIPPRFHDPQGEEHDRIEAEEEAAARAENLAYIRERIELVRAGEETKILDFLAHRFLNIQDRSDDLKGLSGIREEFDEEVEQAAVEGFLSLLEGSDWPSPEKIGELSARGERFTEGRTLLVGALIAQKQGATPKLSESPGLRAALAFEFVEGEYDPSSWYVSVIEAEPAIASDIVDAVWRPVLKTQPKSVVHLFKVDEEPGLKLIAGRIGLRLLEDNPQAHPELLEQLMRAALVGAAKADLTALVDREVQPQDLPEDRRELWLALGAIVNPEESMSRMTAYLQGDGASERVHRLVERLKDLNGVAGWSIFTSSPSTLASYFKLLGAIVPPPTLPSGTIDAYDRSQFVARFASELGNRLDDESMARLSALRDDPTLSAWRERLAEIAEQQSRKVRDSRYQRPSLENTLRVLTAGEPVNPGDLHALVCDQLRTLIEEIEHGAGSGFRTFWNVSGGGDQLQSPTTENEARSRLRDRLNERLAPLGIAAEIEGNYSGGNRGDLKVIYRSMNVPVEVKRHYHEEVWEAPETQLKDKYAIDPGSGGYGIYLVFWFGEDKKDQRVPAPPAGIARPGTAAEMEIALRQIYSGEEWSRTEFFCVDCSKR